MGLPLGETLIKLGYLTEDQMRQALCLQMNVPFLDLTRVQIDPSLARLINRTYAVRHVRRAGVAGGADAHRRDERSVGPRRRRGAGAVHRLHHPRRHQLAARDPGRHHAALLAERRQRRGRGARKPRARAGHRGPRHRQGIHGAEPPRRRHRPADLQHRDQPRLQRRPHGAAVAQPAAHPLPHRRRAARARSGAAAAGLQRERAVDRVARQDPRQARYLGTAPPAGRQLPPARRGADGRHARLRPPRVGDAELLRRERRRPHPRSAPRAEVDRQPEVRALGRRAVEEAAVAHVRHRPHHRPDGLRQEHHALRRAAEHLPPGDPRR